jgi:diguanylate cyclase (GGDEF)-like protein/putative nucleotidyltransferase with HDIG domain
MGHKRSMHPPLRQRLRWQSMSGDGVEAPATRAMMARTAALFAGAGAVICLVGAFVPGDAQFDDDVLMVTAAVAALLGAVLLIGYDAIPARAFHLVVAAGTAVATGAAYGWGTASAYGPLPYVWVTLFAFYFFTRGAALVHLALMAAAYAVALVIENPADNPLDGWIATVVTLLVTGLFVSMVRDHIARLIRRLSDAAHRDHLTGLLNRRGFQGVFDTELERARRADQALSLIVGDLDRFKRVNDAHGHAAGDEVLVNVAQAIAGAKRGFDSAARVGGEEFAVLAPDCDEHGAFMLAERIRAGVHEALVARDPGSSLTISFGISTFPLHGQSADGLLRTADQALYAAKQLGRNRSVISSAEVPGILARGTAHEDAEAHVELAALLNLAEALDVRDWGTASHCRRVGRFAELTARELGLSPEAVERVRLAGILHDVGRAAVPEALLAKDGPLTEEEWVLVRNHTVAGARMVETTEYDDIRSWILFHHERPDGAGYPEGRTESEVPLEAAIIGAADAYEAMTSERPYRPALAAEAAAGELRSEAGRQFRADVVDALLRAV